jgi:hypothetical protein
VAARAAPADRRPVAVLDDLLDLGPQFGKGQASDSEHHRVLGLILAKDGDGAERVMREHVRLSHQALMAGIDEQQDQVLSGRSPRGPTPRSRQGSMPRPPPVVPRGTP